MKVAIIYNKDFSYVINKFGMQNKEIYNEATVRRVAMALEANGHNVEIIDGNMNVIESLQGFMPKVLEGEKMGMVFNMAYGIQGESRYTHIPSLLEMIGIPYVGSNPAGHALALDKVIAKIIMQKQHIPTPNFWVYSNHLEDMSDVVFPVIIKPKMEAVSFGLRVVDNEADLKDAVKFIIEEFNQQALVEQFIPGREFAVGLLGNSPTEAFNVLEIDLDNDPNAIQSVTDKKVNPRNKICPADIPESLAKAMQDASIKAFEALQLNDFARVDIRLDAQGNFYILEINSMASMGATGSYSFAAQASGYNYRDLVNRMLHVAAIRYFGEQYNVEPEILHRQPKTINLNIKSFLREKQRVYKDMLSAFVNINSYVRNVEGVNQLSALIKKYLSNLGFAFQVIPQAEIGSIYYFTNSDSEECDIMLVGNLDHSDQINEHKYFSETEQRYYGTGVWQNKGGLVVMIAALQSLKKNKLLSKQRIGILLTTDSSIKNKVSAATIQKRSALARYVIGLTGSFLEGGLVTSRSGAATYNISMNLINQESEQYIEQMTQVYIKLVSSFLSISDREQGILVTPYSMNFNSNVINVAAHGKISLSVRFNYLEQLKNIESKIVKMLPKYKNILDSYMSIGNKRPGMIRTQKVDKLWSIFKDAANSLDIRLREEHRWSSSDICFVSDEKFKIDGVGPVGISDENKNEYILKYSLIERAALLATVINNLSEE